MPLRHVQDVPLEKVLDDISKQIDALRMYQEEVRVRESSVVFRLLLLLSLPYLLALLYLYYARLYGVFFILLVAVPTVYASRHNCRRHGRAHA